MVKNRILSIAELTTCRNYVDEFVKEKVYSGDGARYSIFQDRDDKHICKAAKTAQEAVQLIELGFEYVTGEYHDGGKLLKKQKLLYLGSQS